MYNLSISHSSNVCNLQGRYYRVDIKYVIFKFGFGGGMVNKVRHFGISITVRGRVQNLLAGKYCLN